MEKQTTTKVNYSTREDLNNTQAMVTTLDSKIVSLKRNISTVKRK
jgi:hypothetical protein